MKIACGFNGDYFFGKGIYRGFTVYQTSRITIYFKFWEYTQSIREHAQANFSQCSSTGHNGVANRLVNRYHTQLFFS